MSEEKRRSLALIVVLICQCSGVLCVKEDLTGTVIAPQITLTTETLLAISKAMLSLTPYAGLHL